MMKRNKLTFTISLICLFTLAFAACDDPEYEAYEDWDIDDDAYIDNDEFYDGIVATGYYTDLDLDQDANLNYGELYDSYYNVWDLDNDNFLDQQEWNSAIDLYYDDYDYVIYGNFEDWDLNDDGQIGMGEYQEGVGDTGLFTAWDLDEDELITEEEFSRGAYRYWDTDGDGQIEAVEYEEWSPVYWD